MWELGVTQLRQRSEQNRCQVAQEEDELVNNKPELHMVANV